MASKQKELLNRELHKFKLDHYKNMDVDYWFNKVNSLHTKMERLKDPKKQSRVVFELYSTYLQILEVLFINSNAVGKKLNYFPGSLFISSKKLQKFIDESFTETTRFSTWFMDNYIFSIQREAIDYKERYKQYSNLIKECAKDYLDNYQLLNAYKHGCRVVAQHGKNYVSLTDKHGKNHLLVEGNCQITYFSKEPLEKTDDPALEGTPTVFKRSISFKIERVFGDCAFIITLLQNMRLVTLHSLGAKPKGPILQVTLQKDEWKKSFGGFSFKQPLFSVGAPDGGKSNA